MYAGAERLSLTQRTETERLSWQLWQRLSHSDYENAPGGLATFRGFCLRLWLRLSCDFCDYGSDYEILKTVCNYATLTRPAPSPMPGPEPPGHCHPANSGPDRRVCPLGLCRHGPATLPRAAQNPGRGAACHAWKRPAHGIYSPCSSGIILHL